MTRPRPIEVLKLPNDGPLADLLKLIEAEGKALYDESRALDERKRRHRALCQAAERLCGYTEAGGESA